MAIISMAQQARPNATGQMAERRDHWTSLSTLVVRNGWSLRSSLSSASEMVQQVVPLSPGRLVAPAPVEHALAPDVDEAGEQQPEEDDDLDQPDPAEVAQRQGPRVEERDLDVEQQEHHRHEVVLDRLAFAGVADRGHAALVGRRFLDRRLARPEELRQKDVAGSEAAADEQDENEAEPAFHVGSWGSCARWTVRRPVPNRPMLCERPRFGKVERHLCGCDEPSTLCWSPLARGGWSRPVRG